MRRPARASRSNRRYRYSRSRSRSAFRSARHYRSTSRRERNASRREFVAKRAVLPVTRPAPQPSETVGMAPRASDDRAGVTVQDGLNAGDSFVVHVRKSITLPMPAPTAQGNLKGSLASAVQPVTTAAPPPLTAQPAQVAAAVPQVEPENTGIYIGMPAQSAAPAGENDVTLLRAAFLAFAGLLALGTAVRLVIG